MNDAIPSPAVLVEIEELAVELARLAGAEIMNTLSSAIIVEYKPSEGGRTDDHANPVSEVDRAVEALIRSRVGERYPAHGIIGEEMDVHPDPTHEYVWVIDPVDGTTNFINGYPLFCASIGVLHRGVPIVGAIWCSTGHELRTGVYHAHLGGPLLFEGRPVPAARPSVGVQRRLAARPGGLPGRRQPRDTRVTGSTAIECAFVAAGIFISGMFWAPWVWDVAAGVVLIRAAGLEAWMHDGNRWVPLERFEAPTTVTAGRAPSVRDWKRPLAIGSPEGIAPSLEFQRDWRWRLRGRLRRLANRWL